MNPTAPTVPLRRRIWLWVLALCLAPFVLLGIAAFSFLTLDRDSAALRQRVMAATHADWHTRVQVSVGRFTLSLVRTGLSFVKQTEIADARLALNAVSRVSVGVYERNPQNGESWSRPELCAAADEVMTQRGWSRLVGVLDQKDTVLVYVPKKYSVNGPIDVCLSVTNDRTLVVVTTTVNADGLAELITQYAGDDVKHDLKFAKF